MVPAQYLQHSDKLLIHLHCQCVCALCFLHTVNKYIQHCAFKYSQNMNIKCFNRLKLKHLLQDKDQTLRLSVPGDVEEEQTL